MGIPGPFLFLRMMISVGGAGRGLVGAGPGGDGIRGGGGGETTIGEEGEKGSRSGAGGGFVPGLVFEPDGRRPPTSRDVRRRPLLFCCDGEDDLDLVVDSDEYRGSLLVSTIPRSRTGVRGTPFSTAAEAATTPLRCGSLPRRGGSSEETRVISLC